MATALLSNGQDAAANARGDAGSSPASASKLYAIVRGDLPPGLQAAQLGHALIGYVLARPGSAGHWYAQSSNLVCLAVPSEAALRELAGALIAQGLPTFCFFEPDLEDQLTAVSTGPEAQRFLSNLPLALR